VGVGDRGCGKGRGGGLGAEEAGRGSWAAGLGSWGAGLGLEGAGRKKGERGLVGEHEGVGRDDRGSVLERGGWVEVFWSGSGSVRARCWFERGGLGIGAAGPAEPRRRPGIAMGLSCSACGWSGDRRGPSGIARGRPRSREKPRSCRRRGCPGSSGGRSLVSGGASGSERPRSGFEQGPSRFARGASGSGVSV
jgi:hypothetical protein